jgi:Flp pilus assembly CpaE family ATPase
LFDTLGVEPHLVRLILNLSTKHAIETAAATELLGRHPDFVIANSESLDRAASTGRPLVTADPDDPLVEELRGLADSIVASVPLLFEPGIA